MVFSGTRKAVALEKEINYLRGDRLGCYYVDVRKAALGSISTGQKGVRKELNGGKAAVTFIRIRKSP